jgi:hypothetical protein
MSYARNLFEMSTYAVIPNLVNPGYDFGDASPVKEAGIAVIADLCREYEERRFSVGMPYESLEVALYYTGRTFVYVHLISDSGIPFTLDVRSFAFRSNNTSALGRHSWYRCFDGPVLNWNRVCAIQPFLSTALHRSLRKGLLVESRV